MKRDLQCRTKHLALPTIRFSSSIPRGVEGQIIKRQLIQAASSLGANYRAVCRALSQISRNFIEPVNLAVRLTGFRNAVDYM